MQANASLCLYSDRRGCSQAPGDMISEIIHCRLIHHAATRLYSLVGGRRRRLQWVARGDWELPSLTVFLGITPRRTLLLAHVALGLVWPVCALPSPAGLCTRVAARALSASGPFIGLRPIAALRPWRRGRGAERQSLQACLTRCLSLAGTGKGLSSSLFSLLVGEGQAGGWLALIDHPRHNPMRCLVGF